MLLSFAPGEAGGTKKQVTPYSCAPRVKNRRIAAPRRTMCALVSRLLKAHTALSSLMKSAVVWSGADTSRPLLIGM